MSRAQYQQPYSPQYGSGMPGTVVNGGLIDFQDNLYRGVQECVTPSMLLQQHNHVMAAAQQPQYGLNAANFSNVPVSMQGQVLCGPASFIHVNGVTYKPVEEPNSKPVSTPDAARAGSDPAVSSSSSSTPSEPGPRMLSRKELDDRVRNQVEAYMRNQHGYTQQEISPPVSYRDKLISTASAEDLAAQRVYDLNAGMPVVRNSGKGGKGKVLLQNRW